MQRDDRASALADDSAGDHIWTERARDYGWDTGSSLSSRLKLDLIRKYRSRQAALCDIGCGNGLFLRVLAPECGRVTGIDLNAGMLAEARAMIAREGIDNAELVRGSAGALPFGDESFDVVYCFSTLLLVPDVDRALRDMIRVLRRGGVLVLDVAGRNNLASLFWHLWYRRQGHFGIHAFSYPGIRKRIEALGCRPIESHALGFCDQWRYVPGIHWAKRLDRVFHAGPQPERNLDYQVSNRPGVFRFASRWYVVARKEAAP